MEPDSGLDFVVEDLPGIGRSYQMTGINGGRITVIVHHGGRRVVYGLNADSDQASAVELSDHQARKLGAILGAAIRRSPLPSRQRPCGSATASSSSAGTRTWVRSVISSWAERAARSAAGPAPRPCAIVTGRSGLCMSMPARQLVRSTTP